MDGSGRDRLRRAGRVARRAGEDRARRRCRLRRFAALVPADRADGAEGRRGRAGRCEGGRGVLPGQRHAAAGDGLALRRGAGFLRRDRCACADDGSPRGRAAARSGRAHRQAARPGAGDVRAGPRHAASRKGGPLQHRRQRSRRDVRGPRPFVRHRRGRLAGAARRRRLPCALHVRAGTTEGARARRARRTGDADAAGVRSADDVQDVEVAFGGRGAAGVVAEMVGEGEAEAPAGHVGRDGRQGPAGVFSSQAAHPVRRTAQGTVQLHGRRMGEAHGRCRLPSRSGDAGSRRAPVLRPRPDRSRRRLARQGAGRCAGRAGARVGRPPGGARCRAAAGRVDRAAASRRRGPAHTDGAGPQR